MDLEKILFKLAQRSPFVLGSENFSTYSVLLPLVYIKNEIHLLFEVRSFSLRRQPGEVCFPGGKKDETDRDHMETAMRETCEELGLNKGRISQVVPLDFIVSPYGNIIYPFVGVIDTVNEMQLNHREVDHVFTVPLAFFKQTKPEIHYVNARFEPEPGFPYDSIVGGKDYNWQIKRMEECFYYFEDKVIWGLTARIVRHFIQLIEE
ncbi:CoA pyrophosphatase [Robertmurraya korlensis]|uniref:NUDIX hydrolase n=1 Tax=Robertmurraya korlensis TaxID=519977 RepID=UPI00203EA226|nr:CoA pyrophosphatase [Robertmurraya korlensis]MCM3603591.1 CoA pyrophosphatase [Robertmurraya korlensis]